MFLRFMGGGELVEIEEWAEVEERSCECFRAVVLEVFQE